MKSPSCRFRTVRVADQSMFTPENGKGILYFGAPFIGKYLWFTEEVGGSERVCHGKRQ